jgi:hypothetical protein
MYALAFLPTHQLTLFSPFLFCFFNFSQLFNEPKLDLLLFLFFVLGWQVGAQDPIPDGGISIIETDVAVEFAPPPDLPPAKASQPRRETLFRFFFSMFCFCSFCFVLFLFLVLMVLLRFCRIYNAQ